MPAIDDDARDARRARFERDEGVVDDEHPRLVADAPHDPAHHARIVRPIDPGDAETDRGRTNVEVADGLFHDVMEDLLDLELADRLEIGAASPCFSEDFAVVVRELAHRLGAARVDTENVHHVSDSVR